MIQLGIIFAYLLLLITLGMLSSRRFRGTSKDYMLASHSIGPVLLLMSLFGTTMTAFALVGSSGKAYLLGVGIYGMLASCSGIIHSLCFFLIGLKLWSFGRQHGYRTQIQFFRDRLANDSIGLLLFPILVGLVIPYLLIGVRGAGAVISKASEGAFREIGWFEASEFGLPPWLAALIICLVVLIYVFVGGMRGTVWANAFQTAVFMVLGLIAFIIIAYGLGGKEGLFANLRAATEAASQDHLSRVRIPKPTYFSFLLIPLSVAMFPHVFQHWLTARSAESFKLPIVVHPIFIMIVWLPCVLVGVWATGAGLDKQVNPDQVLATLVHNHATPVLMGLLTAGILAAIMSSMDSQFLCLGTMFTNDIMLHYFGKDRFNEKQVVMMARLFVVGIVALTYLLSLISPANVFDMAIWCFSGFAGLFPLVAASIYWKRLTSAGAFASILSTVVAWIYLFVQSGYAKNPRYSFPEKPIPLFAELSIPPLMPVVGIFLFSLVSMVLVSWLTRPPVKSTLQKFFPETGG